MEENKMADITKILDEIKDILSEANDMIVRVLTHPLLWMLSR